MENTIIMMKARQAERQAVMISIGIPALNNVMTRICIMRR